MFHEEKRPPEAADTDNAKRQFMHSENLPAWRPDQGDGSFKNPILHADYSDPDILRVGNDFYLVSSSFTHMPALPILHSRDLVNWRIINHVFDRLELPGYENFQPGRGVWAPSIRYHAGRYWVFFSTPDEGIFMCQTEDPRAQWSAPHCLKSAKGWIDPCPFWDDDGRAWLVHAFAYSRSGIKHRLQLCAMSPDGLSLLDDGQIIYDGALDLPTLEGPKVYKRGGWYYIFAPAGGVATGWQTVLRSRNLSGPYESRNVLHQGGTAVNGPHQGGWVELPSGEGWFVHFQDADIYGRIVHLQPLAWEDDWPLIGTRSGKANIGEPVSQWKKPSVSASCARCEPQTSDDFAEGRPGLQWQWQANPVREWIRPGQQGLTLSCEPLPLRGGKSSLYDAPNLLLQKFPAKTFMATTRVEAALLQDGEQCGIMIFGERFAALGLCRQNAGLLLTLDSGWMSDREQLTTQCLPLETWPADTVIYLRITVRQNGLCRFSYSADGADYQPVNMEFAAGAGKWVGAKTGIFAVSCGQRDNLNAKGSATFSYFTVEPLMS